MAEQLEHIKSEKLIDKLDQLLKFPKYDPHGDPIPGKNGEFQEHNKDLLSEIHKSKSSFCSYSDPDYATYDLIVPNIEKINIRTIAQAKRNKARRLGALEYERRKKINPKVRYSDCEISYQKILKKDLVFRVMTYDHVPDEIGRRRNPRSIADRKTKVNFPPFQHWKFNKNENLVCIGKSHWEGGLHNGKFNKGIGQVTNRLAMMWMKLCERYATRGNVRGYTYNDEMQGQAILQLAQIGMRLSAVVEPPRECGIICPA